MVSTGGLENPKFPGNGQGGFGVASQISNYLLSAQAKTQFIERPPPATKFPRHEALPGQCHESIGG
jgi:hypothetical protein